MFTLWHSPVLIGNPISSLTRVSTQNQPEGDVSVGALRGGRTFREQLLPKGKSGVFRQEAISDGCWAHAWRGYRLPLQKVLALGTSSCDIGPGVEQEGLKFQRTFSMRDYMDPWVQGASLNESEQSASLADSPAPRGVTWHHQPAHGLDFCPTRCLSPAPL